MPSSAVTASSPAAMSSPAAFASRSDLPLLLCLSHLRWDFVFQRPQHLLCRAARDYRVIFLEEPHQVPDRQAAPRLETRVTAHGVLIATPILPQGMEPDTEIIAQAALLNDLIGEFGEPAVTWYYSSMFLPIAGHLEPSVTIYDCMDELSLFRGASPQLQLLERRLLKRADFVFAGGGASMTRNAFFTRTRISSRAAWMRPISSPPAFPASLWTRRIRLPSPIRVLAISA